MAANQERTLKVSFAGDATNLTDVIQVVRNNFEGVDTVIKSVSTTLDNTGKKMVANVELVAKSLEHLEELKGKAAAGIVSLDEKVYKKRPLVVKSDEDALARREAADRAKAALLAQKEADETAKKAAAARAVLSTALKEQSKENVRTFYEEIKSKEVIAQNGANSIVAIKQREKDALLAAEREYNAKVMAYADRIAEGTRTEKQAQADMRKSEAAFERKVRSIKAEAATEIEIEKKKQDEIARLVKEQKATLAIATARQATDPQRMALIRAEVEEERAIQTRGQNDAYTRQLEYNRKRLQAEQALQQELAGIKTAQAFGKFTPEEAFNKSTAALATYKKTLQDLPSLNKHVQEHQNLIVKVAELIGVYRVLSTVWNTSVSALKAIPKIGIELEATKSILTSTTGSSSGMAAYLAGITKEADRAGISLESARESFRNFHASTSLAGQSAEQTWKMYTSLNSVITSLHLSTDQASGVFTAIAQIFNKSKVQSEELVKQLGNLLPGALAAFQKANADVYKSIPELLGAMKDGTVFAQNTVEKFTSYLETRFAKSFAIAADGVNANTNRMNNSFTLLGEAIYKANADWYNSLLKTITQYTNTLTGAVEGTNKLSTVLDLLGTAFKATFVYIALSSTKTLLDRLVMVAKSTETLTGALSNTKTALLGLAGPAVLTGLSLVSTKLLEIGAKQKEVYEAGIKSREEYERAKVKADISKPISVRAEASEEVVTLQKKLEESKKLLDEWRLKLAKGAHVVHTGEEKSIVGVTPIQEAITKQTANYKFFADAIIEAKTKAREEIFKADKESLQRQIYVGVDISAEMGKIDEAYAKYTGNAVEKADKMFQRLHGQGLEQSAKELEFYKARLKESAEAGTSGLARLSEGEAFWMKNRVKELEDYRTKTETVRKGMLEDEKRKLAESSGVSKATSSQYKINLQELQGAANDTQAALKHIDASYKNFEISISEYMSRKRQALDAGLAAELKEIEQNKQLAISIGDTNKAREYDVRAKELQNKFANERNALLDDENTKTRELTTSLDALNDRVLKLRGAQVTDKATEELQARINRELAAGNTNPALQQGLQNIETEKYLIQLKKDAANAQAATADEYQAKMTRINILRQNGLLGELSATQQLAKLDEEHIALREKAVQVMQKEADEMVAGGDRDAALIKIKRYKEETENLKITAASVGRLFEEKIGASFERTFTGLVQGTIRGKDAFKSFAASVVSDMISIVAQEARSAILQPLLKAGFSALGGIFGGMFGGASISGDPTGAGLGVAQTVAPVSPFQGTYLANGGVMSGPGISAYSSSIVDKPTIFPFAKGTGLMGEAGPEAIMPLQRINGKLGVRAEIAQSQSQTIVHSPVFNISMAKNDDPEGVGMKLAEGYIRGIARQEIVNSARIGGKTGQKLAT